MSRLEQETTITFNAEEQEAIVWSADPVFIRRMEKLGCEPTRQDGPTSLWFTVPKSWVKIKRPVKRNLTEEQKQALADRLRKAREAK